MTAQLTTTKVTKPIEKNSPEYFAEKYRSYGNKTVNSILHMAFSVSQAKEKGDSCFSRFCELINQDEKGSLIRKFIRIGLKFKFLNSKSNKLPSNWTTIYMISGLEIKKIEDLIVNGVINPLATNKDIEKACDIKKKAIAIKKIKTNHNAAEQSVPFGTGLEFKAQMDDAPNDAAKVILKGCIASLKSIGIHVQTSQTLDAFLD